MSVNDDNFYERFIVPLASKQKDANDAHSKNLVKLEKVLDSYLVDFLAAHLKNHEDHTTLDTIKFEALAARYREVGEFLAEVVNAHRDLVQRQNKDHDTLMDVAAHVDDLTEGMRYLASAIVNLSDAVYAVTAMSKHDQQTVRH